MISLIKFSLDSANMPASKILHLTTSHMHYKYKFECMNMCEGPSLFKMARAIHYYSLLDGTLKKLTLVSLLDVISVNTKYGSTTLRCAF